jgi:hypothetical protein
MKQMRQPRKDVLREQLALAADEIIRLKTVMAEAHTIASKLLAAERARVTWKPAPPAPWWRRLLGWLR